MSERSPCAAASRCTNFEVLAGRNGKRRVGGRRVSGVQFENSACGNVTCSEDCALIHGQECEPRLNLCSKVCPHML